MSMDIGFTDDWADGTYHFKLGAKQLDELQDITGIGAELLYWRLSSPIEGQRDWRTKWMRETIRLALIGGGTLPAAAEKLCRFYVDDQPKLQNRPFAVAALGAALVGVSTAVKKKARRSKTDSEPSQTTEPDASTLPDSTEASAPSG